MELMAPIEEICSGHRRPNIAIGGVSETRLHRQLVVIQVLHSVQILGLFLDGEFKVELMTNVHWQPIILRVTAISVNRNRNGLKDGDPQELWAPR